MLLVHPVRIPSYGYPIGSFKQSVLWPVFFSYKYVLYIRRHTNPCTSRWRFALQHGAALPEDLFSERRSSHARPRKSCGTSTQNKIDRTVQFCAGTAALTRTSRTCGHCLNRILTVHLKWVLPLLCEATCARGIRAAHLTPQKNSQSRRHKLLPMPRYSMRDIG